MVLALLGDGSTLRGGPWRSQLRRGVAWLRKQMDDRGRIGLRTDLAWFTDHALASFVLAEALQFSRFLGGAPELTKHVNASAGFVASYLDNDRVTVTPEFLFWSRCLASALRKGPADKKLADRIVRAVWRRGGSFDSLRPTTDRDRAIQLLTRLRFGARPTAHDKDLAEVLAKVDTIGEMDPLAVALYSLAFYQRGPAHFETWQKAVEQQVVRSQLRTGEGRGSWHAPTGDIGPMQTTACRFLTLEVHYRYIRSTMVE